MKKINIAELLKDCPKGMELDCTMYDDTVFYGITDDQIFPIRIKRVDGGIITLTKYGEYSNCPSCKCVIFPKGKTTWEGFVAPSKFKNGDIVVDDSGAIFLYKQIHTYYEEPYADFYCGLTSKLRSFIIKTAEAQRCGKISSIRLATKEEKAKLFQSIKDNGYKWNEETKTLEKLIEPKFHEGDWVVTDYGEVNQVITVSEDGEGFTLDDGSYFSGSWKDMYHLWTIQDAKDGDVLFHSDSASNGIFIFKEIVQHGTIQEVTCYCDYDSEDGFCLGEYHTCCWTDSKILHPATKEQCNRLFQKMKKAGYEWNEETKTLEKLIQPKFKVGDRIRRKNGNEEYIIISINDCTYYYRLNEHCTGSLGIQLQDEYELVPNKFDINTLVPFESKVLIRDHKSQKWNPAIWGTYDNDPYYPYRLIGTISHCCIPYEGNEHLLGTTNDCDDFYKIWE